MSWQRKTHVRSSTLLRKKAFDEIKNISICNVTIKCEYQPFGKRVSIRYNGVVIPGKLKMKYVRITKENIDQEHICCAMSGNQSLAKKEWLKRRFDEGLVFYRSEDRGKCFIEYIPAENAWVPIDADGYLYIDCLWIAGEMKGKGYSNDLLGECIKDAKEHNKKGVCILTAEGRKREFLSDAEYLKHKGFSIADKSDCGITLMYLPVVSDAVPPKFCECAKHPTVSETGFVLYYTDQCPFTYYWVRE